MVRFVIIGIVIAVAFTLYALVDAAMTDGSRARGVSKPVWVVLVVVLPVIGGVLWFMIGKGAPPAKRPTPPDDDPRFTGTRMSSADLDSHMRDLEQRLRELDDEKFPGEEGPERPAADGESRGEEQPGPDDDAAQK
ncbi:PLDc N-terminal domain-containing protein [Leucobacter chironomi]|uniref:PLDc N-terminal domain-containing protein n=1 Tax=Leucobacter chironomi TaxID=491918 RepID=UPI000410624E|nr:PLDc N-terminal domain-containing protein [Leucobacter chironomi]